MPSLVEIGPAAQEKKIFKLVHVFSQFRNYLPLEKGGTLHLKKLEFPSVPSLVEIGPGSGNEDENVKSLRQRQQRRQRTHFDQKSSLEPLAKVSYKKPIYISILIHVDMQHTYVNMQYNYVNMRLFMNNVAC